MSKFIEHDLYCKIIENIPIVCVDLLILFQGRFLLVKRKNEPLAGELYFPGGRLHKFETPEQAAIRIAKQETGLDCQIRSSLGTYNTIFDNGYSGIKVHSVNLVYFLSAKHEEVKLDEQSSEYVWCSVNHVPNELDINLRKFVEDVFGNQL